MEIAHQSEDLDTAETKAPTQAKKRAITGGAAAMIIVILVVVIAIILLPDDDKKEQPALAANNHQPSCRDDNPNDVANHRTHPRTATYHNCAATRANPHVGTAADSYTNPIAANSHTATTTNPTDLHAANSNTATTTHTSKSSEDRQSSTRSVRQVHAERPAPSGRIGTDRGSGKSERHARQSRGNR